jgi:hypothetical protein
MNDDTIILIANVVLKQDMEEFYKDSFGNLVLPRTVYSINRMITRKGSRYILINGHYFPKDDFIMTNINNN